MQQTATWPVETSPIGRISTGTALFRLGGTLRVTVVAKACFSLVQGGSMILEDPPELLTAEVHHADNPTRSIRAASDTVPYLEKADVLFIGAAYAPGGAPVTAMSVRLVLARGGYALVEKLLSVYGDRPPTGGDPKPFTRMPIVYERAFGGIGLGDNPLGTATPNIVYAEPGRQKEPAGFGPISWYWPSRKRLLRGHPRQALEQRVVEIPDGFEMSFFQAAPEDQRAPFLQGDETVVLQGLNPSHPALESHLPGARAMARVYTTSGMGRPFPLVADTILIDGDAEQCHVTWRGSFPVTSEDALAELCVAAGLELGGTPIAWPDRPPARQSEASQRGRPMPAMAAETVSLSDEETTIRRPVAKRAPPSSAPRAAAPPPPPSENPLEGTLVLDSNNPPPSTPVSPFIKPRPKIGDSTASIGDHPAKAPHEIAAPFRIAASGSSTKAPAAPIPGAPWAGSKAAPRPKPATNDLTSTITDQHQIPAVAAPPAPAPPKAAPKAPPAPEKQDTKPAAPEKPATAPEKEKAPEKTPEKPAWSWAPQPEAPSPAPANTKAPPPPPPPKPAVKSKIYGGFGEPKKK